METFHTRGGFKVPLIPSCKPSKLPEGGDHRTQGVNGLAKETDTHNFLLS